VQLHLDVYFIREGLFMAVAVYLDSRFIVMNTESSHGMYFRLAPSQGSFIAYQKEKHEGKPHASH
jgi:hypothetical protein